MTYLVLLFFAFQLLLKILFRNVFGTKTEGKGEEEDYTSKDYSKGNDYSLLSNTKLLKCQSFGHIALSSRQFAAQNERIFKLISTKSNSYIRALLLL